ncbi:hypothetical protein A4D02_26780 [Niastella koreensis]|uniref:DUF4268 domain-containing protein n=2 Tax=Niastella koreensis TaxID=354356 RepID=G8TEM5_NIAKG|nr:hypothetical protein [Niastella koreensis]AEV99447.1 hypothetical protein Niako_3117 [Niastella koreensis GR20-10]OQP50046.1 hypothetical protein A4D02_26780 [Niastella koreensis]
MNFRSYLKEFENAAGRLDRNLLAQKEMETETGVWLESVVLRMHKKHWANKPLTQPQGDAAIFFSVWLNDKGVQGNKLFYNLHALKLRQLKAYTLTSREFAAAFREQFKSETDHWPNVSTNFGPLTLMEGWMLFDPADIAESVYKLANQFLEIDSLIDGLLKKYKKTSSIL